MKDLSKCGVCCSTDCKAYQIECDGCNELEGKDAWAKFYDKIFCPIYECVEQKEFQSYKECGKHLANFGFQLEILILRMKNFGE